jgi:hypothetical protein
LTAQELWEVRRLEWIRQFVKLGKYPNSRSKDIDEKRSGVWQSQTRTNYKKGKLTDIRIEILNNIEGWKWVDSENRAEIIIKTFEENSYNWIEQFVKLGKYPNARSKNADEKRSGQWQSQTRTNYKKGKLTDIIIEILNNIEGWKWEVEDPFQENLDDWIRQFELLGRTPKQRSKDDDEKRTGTWQSTMRQNYKKGKLTDIRIEILNNIEGWKWEGNSK